MFSQTKLTNKQLKWSKGWPTENNIELYIGMQDFQPAIMIKYTDNDDTFQNIIVRFTWEFAFSGKDYNCGFDISSNT